MFSSRNIHLAILGIILGATSGYVFAFYRVQSRTPAAAAPGSSPGNTGSNGTGGLPQNHPEVSNDQLTAMFKEALEKNPNQPELMIRYANFLLDLERYSESVEWYKKVLALQPDNLGVRTDMGTALWKEGKTDEALAEYRKSLAANPNHMLTLQNLFVVLSDGKKDLAAAEAVLKKMEQIDPKYAALPNLRKKLVEDRNKAAN